MFAIVDILGQQIKVTENAKYYVPKLKAEADSEITFDKVLVLADDKGTKIGTPYLETIKVTAKVIAHLKDEKVTVFKKKRRKGYQKLNNHRQQLSRIEVTKIG